MGNELRTALIGYAPEYGEKNNNILTYAGAGYGSKYALDEDKRSDSAAYGGMGLKYLANGGYLDPTKRNIVGERGPEEIVGTPRGFYVMPRKKRKTDAFFPTAPENYTPANRMPAMPDLSGGEPQGMTTQENISQLMNLQTKPNGDGRFPVVDPNTVGVGLPGQEGLAIQENPNLVLNSTAPQEKKGIYDNWKTPVFGNMPLDQFVQLTGMMANAIAPNEWSGRLGGNMALMAGQANRDRLDYEEREQQRADINKKYEDQKKENRLNRLVDFASKSKNPDLQKIAYDKWKSEYEQDGGTPLPEWDAMETPTVMQDISQFHIDADKLGFSTEEIKEGERAILNNAYGIKEEKKEETWSDPYETNVGGKKALVQKSSTGKITPVIQDKSMTISMPGGVGQDNRDRTFGTGLRKEFNALPEVKQYATTKQQFNNMENAMKESKKTKNFVAVDQSLIMMFNKMMDPASVVRESEYARTPNDLSWINYLKGKIARVQTGGPGLTQQDRNAIYTMAKLYHNSAQEKYNQRYREYRGYAESGGVTPDKYFSSPYAEGSGGSGQSIGRFTVKVVE